MLLVVSSVVYAANEQGGSGGTGEQGGSGGTQTTQNQTLPKISNPLHADSIQEIILLAVDIAIYVGTAFAILAIIFVGFQFVAAQGNEEKLKDAKKWFFYIIIGFAILISAKVIVEIVKTTLIQSGVVNESVWNPK